MDTNKMREEFIRAYRILLIKTDMNIQRRHFELQDGEFVDHQTAIAWWAWQASREAVVVELPEMLNEAQVDEVEVAEVLLSGQGLSNLAGSVGCAYLLCKDFPILRAAIEAQGLKVAP